jgi:hypothetical protein
MSKSIVIVLSVLEQGISPDRATLKFKDSKRWVNKLLARYQSGGLEALGHKSKRPHKSPNKTSVALENRIVKLRLELVGSGFDAGPASIAARLKLAGKHPPAISTIRRILQRILYHVHSFESRDV